MNQNTESLQKQEPNEKTPAFNIYVMSYMRPNRIMTQDHFEYCTYVVREEEAELYVKGGGSEEHPRNTIRESPRLHVNVLLDHRKHTGRRNMYRG